MSDAIIAGSVIVDQAEVELGAGIGLSHASEQIKAFGYRSWTASVLIFPHSLVRITSFDNSTFAVGKLAGFVDAKDCRESWSIDQGLFPISSDGVFDSIEEQL